MIVTRAKADEAAELLSLSVANGFSEASIGFAYKLAAKQAHPDAGGSVEAFAKVDWARHALLAWLRQQGQARPMLQANACQRCAGRGRIATRAGFRSYTMACPACHGSGDADLDVARTDHGR